MIVNKVDLEVVAVNQQQYPENTIPEIAFVGRSNVGKSSLINSLINRKRLARTSGDPGKTQTINFYNVENKLYFVDLPGYGYAKVSKKEKAKWGEMIETYLKNRKQLQGIIMLVDIRHNPTNDDLLMYEWLKHFNYKAIIACTKADKISKSQVNKNISNIKKVLNVNEEDKTIVFSSKTKQGKDEIWNLIEDFCVNTKEV